MCSVVHWLKKKHIFFIREIKSTRVGRVSVCSADIVEKIKFTCIPVQRVSAASARVTQPNVCLLSANITNQRH